MPSPSPGGSGCSRERSTGADSGERIAAEAAPTGGRARRWLAVLFAAGALWLLGSAGWIHAKAQLAQWLLHDAWAATIVDGGEHRPWPWADTHPVARLAVERLGVDQIVLAGDSGRVLAFGPGWAPTSARPGETGTVVLSGHRDTHFGWLQQLRDGDVVTLQGAAGSRRYRITEARIADSRDERLALAADDDRLLLVTCWPFDAVVPGGPLRYVVRAEACGDCQRPQPALAMR